MIRSTLAFLLFIAASFASVGDAAGRAVDAPRISAPRQAAAGRVLYIYNDAARAASEFSSLGDLYGYSVATFPISRHNTGLVSLTAAYIGEYDAVIIADDMALESATSVYSILPYAVTEAIVQAQKPVLSIGYGRTFFGQMKYLVDTPVAPDFELVTDTARALIPQPPSHPFWREPNEVPLQADGTALLFHRLVPTVMTLTLPSSVFSAGEARVDQLGYGFPVLSDRWENPNSGALIACRAAWGFRAPPSYMTDAGRKLFINVLAKTIDGKACTSFVPQIADLTVGAFSSRDAVTVGLPVTVTVLVTNTSERITASDVRLRNTLPASAAVSGVRASQGRCTRANTDLACRFGNLAAGAVASVTVTLRPEIGGVSMRNVSEVWSATEDDWLINNVFTKSVSALATINLSELIAHPVVTSVQQVPPIAAGADLGIFGIEVTSGMQCFDPSQGLAGCPDNSLPVILQKDTMVRVYLAYTPTVLFGSPKLSDVPVDLFVHHDGITETFRVVGTASTRIERGLHDAAELLLRFNGNADKPVRITAHVNPGGAIAETRSNNNKAVVNVTFQRQRQYLDIAGMRWRRTFGGTTYNASGWAVNGGASSWLNAVLPIRNNGVRYNVVAGTKTYTQSMSSGDAQHAAIIAMNIQWIFDNSIGALFGSPALEDKDMVYGWFSNTLYSGGHADMPIYPHAGGLGVVGIGTDRVSDGNQTVDNPGGGALIFGHELVHDFDVMHTNTGDSCGSSDNGTTFPYSSSSIQEFGMNPTTGQIYDPATTHDLMSYCPAGGSRFGWISPFTWVSMTALLDQGTAARFSVPAAPLADGSTLVVALRVANPISQTPAATFDAVALLESAQSSVLPQEGDLALELRSQSDEVLASHPFSVTFRSEYAGHTDGGVFPQEDTADAGVTMRVPWIEGTEKLVVMSRTAEGLVQIGVVTPSVGAPMVNILAPTEVLTPAADGVVTLAWEGKDGEDDPLTYSVLFSPNGVEWSMIASGIPSTTLDIPVEDLPGTDSGALIVVASDGFRVGSAQTSAPIVIPGKQPQALIMSVGPTSTHPVSTLLQLTGSGFDVEDGTLPDVALEWEGSTTGPLGQGPSVSVPDLTLGRHVFTLTVSDSDGNRATASTVIDVMLPRAYVPLALR